MLRKLGRIPGEACRSPRFTQRGHLRREGKRRRRHAHHETCTGSSDMMNKSIKSDHLGGLVQNEETTRSDRVPLTPTSRVFQKNMLCPFRFRVPSRSVGRNLHTPPLRAVRRGGGQPLWDRGPTSVPRRPNPAGLGDHRWMVYVWFVNKNRTNSVATRKGAGLGSW